MENTPTTETTAPPQQKKTMPAIAKVGIGCGILVVIGVIFMVFLVGWCQRSVGDFMRDFVENPERTTAELIIRANPETELVGTDDEAGTITFRDASGKERTVYWADIAEGRLTITDEEGNEIHLGLTDMEDVPGWVPRLPETSSESGSHHRVEQGEVSGSYMALTGMETADIREFLDVEAQALGMSSTADTTEYSAGGQEMKVFGYSGPDGRAFSATVVRQGGGDAQVTFSYEEKPMD